MGLGKVKRIGLQEVEIKGTPDAGTPYKHPSKEKKAIADSKTMVAIKCSWANLLVGCFSFIGEIDVFVLYSILIVEGSACCVSWNLWCILLAK